MATELLLRKDVPNLGTVGQVVKVKDGFARNYLLPRGFAYRITPDNLKRIEVEKKAHQKEMEALKGRLREAAGKLSGRTFKISAKANEEGHLYGSVDAARVAEAIAAEGFAVDAKAVKLAEPLKEIGAHEVEIQLHAEISAKVKVEIAAEAAAEGEAPPEGAPAKG